MTIALNRPTRRRRTADEVEHLIHNAAAGDQRSWNELVREFRGLIRAIARRHRLCDADAADVAQATWLKLLDHLDHLNDPAKAGAWLATTARRECLAVLRHRRRNLLCADGAIERESADPPDDQLLTAERDKALRRAFSQLPESDQALLRMLMADPRPAYEEVSAALRMPVGSIGPTRARALGRLRNKIDREGSLSQLAA